MVSFSALNSNYNNYELNSLREPPLLQQVGFELFEVITKPHILLDKVKITFKSNKNWVKVIAYFRFLTSRAPPYWILWRHVVSAIVRKQSILCETIDQQYDVMYSKMAALGKFKSKYRWWANPVLPDTDT